MGSGFARPRALAGRRRRPGAYACWLAIAATAVLLGCASPPPSLIPEAPNLLLIVVDCLRSDHVSANGYPRRTTKNLDRIADQGLSFTRAVSQSTWTRPTMPTLLTGLYPSEHGLMAYEVADGKPQAKAEEIYTPVLDDSVVTLAERLSEAGYTNAVFGEQAQLSRRFGLDQGFDAYEVHLGGTRSINDRFVEWLDQERPERFFTLLHYFDLHWPYCPPPKALAVFRPKGNPFNPCRGAKALKHAIRSGERTLTEDEIEATRAFYNAELFAIDLRVGLLVEELTARGLWEETLVVVTSDHGEEFAEHGGIGHKNWPWNELVRVPLILKPPAGWPGPRGELRDQVVESRTVVSTFLDAAGLGPQEGNPSLLPALTGGEQELPPYAISESSFAVAVSTATHKLITDEKGAGPRLFDLVADPLETTDVAAANREVVRRLYRYQRNWRQGLAGSAARREALSDEAIQELRAIGYLD